jgi:hypothetical protein
MQELCHMIGIAFPEAPDVFLGLGASPALLALIAPFSPAMTYFL